MPIKARLRCFGSTSFEKLSEVIMKKALVLAGFAALLASPVLAQAPAGLYGSGNIVFPNDPAAAAAAGAYSTMAPGADGGAFAHEPAPARAGDCAQRFKSYDPRSGTYLGRDGRRHICR
jgi:hypothetical protein